MHRTTATPFTYAIALGSNQPLARDLDPPALVKSAIEELDLHPLSLIAQSPILQSRPLGPSRRRYANAVAMIETQMTPPNLLIHLQGIERRYGRRRHLRWGARTLDLDIILWSGGIWSSADLAIPHFAFRERNFVLSPLADVAPDWRDPVSKLTVQNLLSRLVRRKPVDHGANPL